MADLNVVILAGGKGTRMFSRLPKVLQPLAGRPLLAHVLETAKALHAGRRVVVYGHEGEQVRGSFVGEDIAWAEQVPQLGTGHAMQCAAPALPADGRTLVLYGDVPLLSTATLTRLLEATSAGAVGLLTQRLDDPTGYGRILRDAAGHVTGIVEHKDATPAQRLVNEINTGILVLPNSRLHGWLLALSNDNVQGEYYLTDVIAMAVADGVDIVTVEPASHWETLGVNTKRQLAELERHWQLEQAGRLMDQGVTLLDPARFDLRGELRCGRDVSIDVGCVFIGKVSLGDNVVIGPHCVLKDVEIAAGTEVAAFSHLDGATVGAGAKIGPYARLRPGAQLADDVHVGNFVEIKKASVGLGSKVNHLSYIGDATVGAGVNVGAGTITCNYDGVNKWQTVIGDRAFIGSGSMLVAPVTVGEGATIGAGSTLTKDAPAGQLTLERARQMTVPGWKRPEKKK